MPQFLYQIRPSRPEMLTQGPTEEEAQLMGEHFAYLQKLTEEGVMILVGRTQNNDETTFGLAIYQAADQAEAEQIMQNDPAIAAGVVLPTLFPFGVALINEAAARG